MIDELPVFYVLFKKGLYTFLDSWVSRQEASSPSTISSRITCPHICMPHRPRLSQLYAPFLTSGQPPRQPQRLDMSLLLGTALPHPSTDRPSRYSSRR